MSRRVRIAIYLVTILVGVLIGAVLLVRTQVTPERVKSALVPRVESLLSRPVSLGNIEVGLFSGIHMTDLRIGQRAAEGTLIAVKALDLRYRFWPLLTGRLVVDRILLSEPHLQLYRDAAGDLNVVDLKNRFAQSTEQGPTERSAADLSFSAPGPVKLLVRSLRLEGGSISFHDRFSNPKSPYRYELTDVRLEARDLTLDKGFPVDCSLRLNGTPLDISGQYNVQQGTGDLLVHLQPLDFIPFAPYYRDLLPGRLRQGSLAARLEVEVAPGRVLSKGHVELQQSDLLFAALPEAPFRDVDLEVDYALTFERDARHLRFSTLLVDYNGLRGEAELDVDLRSEDPFLVAQIELQQLDLRQLFQQMPQPLIRRYEQFSPAGLLDARLELRGRLSSGPALLERAALQLIDVRISNERLRAGISGELNYAEQTLKSDNLDLEYAGQQAQLSMLLGDPLSRPLRGEFTLTSRRLDLSGLLSAERSPEPSGQTAQELDRPHSSATADMKDEIGPFRVPVELSGRVAVERLDYRGLSVEQLQAAVHLSENRLQIARLEGRLAGGVLRGQGRVRLDQPGLAYQGEFSLSEAQLSGLVGGPAPQLANTLSGGLDWQSRVSGRGTRLADLQRHLAMEGDFTLREGRLQEFRLLDGLAGFLGSDALRTLNFDDVHGNYRLADGQVQVNTALKGPQIELDPHGLIGLDGRLELRATARLAPELMDKLVASSDFRNLFADDRGWGEIPLQVTGRLQKPRFGFDQEALKARARNQVKKQIRQQLVPPDAPQAPPLRQMLDDTLNRLFNQ